MEGGIGGGSAVVITWLSFNRKEGNRKLNIGMLFTELCQKLHLTFCKSVFC